MSVKNELLMTLTKGGDSCLNLVRDVQKVHAALWESLLKYIINCNVGVFGLFSGKEVNFIML